MDDIGHTLDLFPPIEARVSGHLDVGDGHEIYWEECGNPEGRPVVFLHGGPGAGCGPQHRRFFDPAYWRIILFDQRGAGRSHPRASIENNTTWHLVDDMERLRAHLGVERWLVFGGSWGALLALVYAIKHPARCTGLILRGVFLGRKAEMDWFLHGMGTFFPEAHRAFVEFLPAAEQSEVLDGYFRRLADPDPAVHAPAAAAWNAYENACSVLMPQLPSPPASPFAHQPAGQSATPALPLARIEAHYFRHAMFVEEDYVIRNIARVRPVPCTIVQGRYDVICPIRTADELARAWPEAHLTVVPDAGHSALEPPIRRALVRATETARYSR